MAPAANLGASLGLVLLHCPWSPAAVLLRKQGARPLGCLAAAGWLLLLGHRLNHMSSLLAAEFRKSTDRSISSSISSKPEWILGSSSQSFAKHDLNMQLDPGFRPVFGCWLHVCSAAEFWIGVHEKSTLLAAKFRKSTDRSISSSISSKQNVPHFVLTADPEICFQRRG
jgi:hypothetical protein